MLRSKLTDWDDDDPQTLQETSSKWDKVVILKHMFTLEELEVSLSHYRERPGLTGNRRIQQPCSRSKRTSEKNAQSLGKSPMFPSLIRRQKAWPVFDLPTAKQPPLVSGYAVLRL